MSGFLSDETYETITKNVPVICVDILPVRRNDTGYEIGVIMRATGSQSGKKTVLGGRIYHSESIDDAIRRHLDHDLNVKGFKHFQDSEDRHPFMVQQYFMGDESANDRYGFDPTKHALALTYIVEIDEKYVRPENEASEFIWVSEKIVEPSAMGFNQHTVVNYALDKLNG